MSTRILKAALVPVSPADPITFALAAAILIAAGILGCLLPALQAVRVDSVFACAMNRVHRKLLTMLVTRAELL